MDLDAECPAQLRLPRSGCRVASPAGRAIRTNRAARTKRRIEVKWQLFLEAGVGGLSVQYTATYDAPISERYHSARSTAALDNSPAAGTCQHVTTSHVVPPHKVVSDHVLSEQHRHWIVHMSGRNISMRVHAFQSLNKSLFECVDCHMSHMIHPARLLQGLVARDKGEAVDMQRHFPATLLWILAEPASRSKPRRGAAPYVLPHVRPNVPGPV